MLYYATERGSIEGPVELDELRKLYLRGVINDQTLVAAAGDKEWVVWTQKAPSAVAASEYFAARDSERISSQTLPATGAQRNAVPGMSSLLNPATLNSLLEEQRHSGLGIASFITSLVAGIGMFLLVVVAGAMEASTPGGIDEESVSAIVVGFFLFAFLFVCLVAIGLGIGGLCQRERKKIFPILGTVFAVCTFIGAVLLMSLGLALS